MWAQLTKTKCYCKYSVLSYGCMESVTQHPALFSGLFDVCKSMPISPELSIHDAPPFD
jgi:hypothetical protein